MTRRAILPFSSPLLARGAQSRRASGAAFLRRARGEHNKMHSCQLGRERRRCAEASKFQGPDTHVSLLISAASSSPLSLSLSILLSLSPAASLDPSFFYVLESRPEVYNLAREVRGHDDATRQSAYAYAVHPDGRSRISRKMEKKKARHLARERASELSHNASCRRSLIYIFLSALSTRSLRVKKRSGYLVDRLCAIRGYLGNSTGTFVDLLARSSTTRASLDPSHAARIHGVYRGRIKRTRVTTTW